MINKTGKGEEICMFAPKMIKKIINKQIILDSHFAVHTTDVVYTLSSSGFYQSSVITEHGFYQKGVYQKL